MIIGANHTTGGLGLAKHLANAEKNEVCELTAFRGLIEPDIHAQVMELTQDAKISRSKKPLYHLHFDPSHPLTDAQWADFFQKVEAEMGLADQPFIEVTHQKLGRFHKHRVYSLVSETGTLIKTSHDFARLEKIARLTELETGQNLVNGKHTHAVINALVREGKADEVAKIVQADLHLGERPIAPLSPKERQIQERTNVKKSDLMASVLDAWTKSDNRQSFRTALQEKGLILARGDKTTVIIDGTGTAHSLSRLLGQASKSTNGKRIQAGEIQARLDGLDLQPVGAIRQETRQTAKPVKNGKTLQFPDWNLPNVNPVKNFTYREDRVIFNSAWRLPKPKMNKAEYQSIQNAQMAQALAEFIMNLISALFGVSYQKENQHGRKAERSNSVKELQEKLDLIGNRSIPIWHDGRENKNGLHQELEGQAKSDTGTIRHVSESGQYRATQALANLVGTNGAGRESDHQNRGIDGATQPISDQARKALAGHILQTRHEGIILAKAISANQEKIQQSIEAMKNPPTIQLTILQNLENDSQRYRVSVDAIKQNAPPNPDRMSDADIAKICIRDADATIRRAQRRLANLEKDRDKAYQAIPLIYRMMPFIGERYKKRIPYLRLCEQCQEAKEWLDFYELERSNRNGNSMARDVAFKRQKMKEAFKPFMDQARPYMNRIKLNQKIQDEIDQPDLANLVYFGQIREARELVRASLIPQAEIKTLTESKSGSFIQPIYQIPKITINQDDIIDNARRPKF